jgi:ureidoacrylate peracid hydrolase
LSEKPGVVDPGTAAAALAHVEPLTTLAAKADPRHTALVVVDVQNDFCAEGGMMDNEGLDLAAVQTMARRLPELISAARAAGALVVFVRNIYSTDGNAYLSDVWLEQAQRARAGSYTTRAVCAPQSWEGDFFGDVRPEPTDPIVTKHRFSAFHNTDLDTILRAHGIRTLVMTGVASNVCVETTAREGFVRDYYIVFTSDGTAAYVDADHQATLRVIDRFFGQVVPVADVLAVWRADGSDAPASNRADGRTNQSTD